MKNNNPGIRNYKKNETLRRKKNRIVVDKNYE